MNDLPGPVAELCAMLGRIDGVEAVMLGGSRATQTADEGSDWDIGVYYRGGIDLAPLARHGEVHPPGSWGLRDLEAALYWTEQARRGAYEVDALLGYLAGIPTYSLMAELALSRTVNGRPPMVGEYPPALAQTGARRWSFHADFSLTHARMRAARGDITGTVGQVAKAIIETAHALACRHRMWVHAGFVAVPASPRELVAWVDGFRAAIEQAREREARC